MAQCKGPRRPAYRNLAAFQVFKSMVRGSRDIRSSAGESSLWRNSLLKPRRTLCRDCLTLVAALGTIILGLSFCGTAQAQDGPREPQEREFNPNQDRDRDRDGPARPPREFRREGRGDQDRAGEDGPREDRADRPDAGRRGSEDDDNRDRRDADRRGRPDSTIPLGRFGITHSGYG